MTTIHDWMRDRGAVTRYRVGSLQAFAEQVRSGEDFRYVLREFLDDINLAAAVRPDELVRMIEQEPPHLEDTRHDAFLGALGEHLAMTYDLRRPAWSTQDDRFLSAWWFVLENASYDAVAIRESPPAFRRRGIFVPASTLERV